jgi:hypothetical protein
MRALIEKYSILFFFYNNLDFVIRFFYSRVPILRDISRSLLFKSLYIRPLDYLLMMNKRVLETLKKNKIIIKGSTVLEVGPGASLIMSIGFLLEGAKSILLIDKYPRWDRNVTNDDIKYMKDNTGRDASKYFDSDSRPRKDIFSYVLNSVEDMRDVESSSVDILMSAGVLEHVTRIEESFKEMNRVLKNNGVMYHYISLGDHYNFHRPFKFLRYSDFVWYNFLSKEGYSFMNRLRVDDYLVLAEKYGFKILSIENVLNESLDIKKINKKFMNKSLEDLKTVDCYVVMRKVRNA